MKKVILKFLTILFAIPFGLFIFSEFTGIGQKEEGFKVYKATSTLPEGKRFIEKYKIKGVAKDVESIAFIDLRRGETFLAYDVDLNNYYIYEKIRYKRVSDKIVSKYELKVHISWINRYGRWVFYAMFAVCVLMVIFQWRTGI